MSADKSTKSAAKKPARPAKFYYPPNVLKKKVGTGGLDPKRLEEAERFIDSNEIDFIPIATAIMQRLDKIVAAARKGDRQGKKTVDAIARPIMELKANGGMFKYHLVTYIADVVLDFLENIKDIDEDSLEIIDAHQNALAAIIGNKLKGEGGKEGRALADELARATKRYYKKHNIEV